MSSDRITARVINIDEARFKGKRVDQVEVNDLLATFVQVIQDNIEPRIKAEVIKAIEPLHAEIAKLRTSLTRVTEQVEHARLGGSEEAGLVVTDEPTASVELATVKMGQEERYPLSTVDIASKIPGSPSTSRVATVIIQLGLKGDSKYWCEIKVGTTTFNRYSPRALDRVQQAFRDPQKHLPQDSPAFRTVMNFLEGS